MRLLARARLRRHRRDGRVPRQPHPQLLRRRLRVRRARCATPPRSTPLGTAGSVRNAMDELDETLPRDLRRRAHRHRPRRDRRRSTTSSEALATIGLDARREPARVRHRHHPRRRLDRALPREADVGPGVHRHHQHRHLRARARRSSTSSAAARSSTSPATCSRRCSTDGQAAVRRRRRRATGRTSARSRPTCRAHKDVLDGRVARRASRASRSRDGVWLGEGAEVAPRRQRRRARR